jgi:hypothetical protein
VNAQELVALADAHGVDFLAVAGAANKPDGIAGKRRRKVVEIEPGITEDSRKKQRIEAPDSAKGKGSRVAKAATYSHAELGIAAGGRDEQGRPYVSQLAWAAIQHTIANDRRPDTLRLLFHGLRYHANKHADQEGWEMQLPGRRDTPRGKRQPVYYVDPLCMLVLDEISFRPAFTAAPALHAICLGIDEDLWESRLVPRFKLLQNRYAMWYGTALGHIQRQINGDAERAA